MGQSLLELAGIVRVPSFDKTELILPAVHVHIAIQSNFIKIHLAHNGYFLSYNIIIVGFDFSIDWVTQKQLIAVSIKNITIHP